MKKLAAIILAILMFTGIACADTITEKSGEIKIGDTLEITPCTITFDSAKEYDEMKFTQAETGDFDHVLSKNDQNSTYIAIKGTFSNNSKEKFDTMGSLYGVAIVDGYEYDLSIFSTSTRIEPLQDKLFYIYALIPNKLIKVYTSCVFKIGFYEDYHLDHMKYDDEKEYDYKYEIVIK